MSAYVAIFKCRLATLLQYRAAAFAAVATQVFWGLMRVMIFTAFYASTSAAQPLTLPQALTFIWLSQAFLQLLPWNVDKEVEAQVKTGNVAYELVRPIELYWLWYTRALAIRTIPTIIRAIPVFIIAGLFMELMAPVSFQAGVAFAISICLGAVVSASITTLVITSLFWTISGEGIQRLMPTMTLLFSGLIVPLPLFPSWAQTFISLQPLRCIIDIPSRIYTGVISVSEAPYYILFQGFWAVVLIAGGKMLMNRAVHKVEIQGG